MSALGFTHVEKPFLFPGEAYDIVRLGELVDFVSFNVRKETKSMQHPSPSSTTWDRNLPMSIVAKQRRAVPVAFLSGNLYHFVHHLTFIHRSSARSMPANRS